jgi:excisionase family DNA binding protein
MSSNMKIPKVCQHCGKEFIARTTVTQFCGDDCAKRNYKKRIRDQKVKAVDNIARQKMEFQQSQTKDKEFLSISETCHLLGASRMTIYRQIKTGSIPAAKIGRRTIIKRSIIDKIFSS